MSELVMIEPRRGEVAPGVPMLEISLGGAPRGLIVLIPGEETPEGEVVEMMNELAAEGFESLSLPARAGLPPLAEARAKERGWEPEQLGVVGIGEGGRIALEIARSREIGAAVSISAALDAAQVEDIVSAPALRTPWLGMFGAEDARLSRADLIRMREALAAGSDVFSRVVVYPGVAADFYRRSENGVSFAASYDARQRTFEWLLARVAARLTPLAVAWRARQAG